MGSDKRIQAVRKTPVTKVDIKRYAKWNEKFGE